MKLQWKHPGLSIGLILTGIVMAGLVMRLVYISHSERLQRDEIFYIMQAQSMADPQAAVFTEKHLEIPPLLCLGMVEIHRLAGWDYQTCGMIWCLLFYPLLPLGVYWLTEGLWNSRRLALAAAALAAFYPDTLWLGGKILRDGPYIALFLFTAGACMKAIATRNPIWFPAAALSAGIAQGWRKEAPELLLIIFLVLVYLWWETVWKHRPANAGSLRKMLLATITGLVLFFGTLWAEHAWSSSRGLPWKHAGIIGMAHADGGTDD